MVVELFELRHPSLRCFICWCGHFYGPCTRQNWSRLVRSHPQTNIPTSFMGQVLNDTRLTCINNSSIAVPSGHSPILWTSCNDEDQVLAPVSLLSRSDGLWGHHKADIRYMSLLSSFLMAGIVIITVHCTDRGWIQWYPNQSKQDIMRTAMCMSKRHLRLNI